MVCCHLHGFTSKFGSVAAIRATLVDELGDQLSERIGFNVGYYEGKQQSKIWLVSKEDLDMMYNCKASDIILWCDEREAQQKRKKETDGRKQMVVQLTVRRKKKRVIKCSKH